ncbi:Predicted arabinose efflux permease, MFS family [Rhizobium mongolense subsp. loessense]|uniref:Predicted arabinose efflux permease, MFS family n=1 Tax=Rhizobium mongolense subsp. loessense TaxID=158890 RepID=A0A1G4TBY2_9HYPH|nr:MFS transporter [Rhizobium mongolense]SCW78943.1 Predicted arabinose efflux permease, MFS family [Rhizobium mongolense subsp. loessense]
MTSENPIQTSCTQVTGKMNITLMTAPPRLATLILLSALAVLPVNMILPSLPNIAATFQADFALVNLSVAGYATVTALTSVIAGAMTDRYGRRPVVLMAVSTFIVASLGCALATNIGVFLLFRAMQASIAACFSLALVLIKETSGEREAASKIGYAAMGWALAPMLGPMFGGTLDELFGWRASFVVFAVLGAAMLALALCDLRETAAGSQRPHGNYLAAYGQLLSSARFWAYTLCMAWSIGTLYIFLGGAPLAVGQTLAGSSAKLGFYMGLVPAGFILGSYLAGRYASKHALGAILIVGRLITCMGLLVGLILSMLATSHVLAFFGPCMLIGIGNGLTMPAANTGVLSVRANLAGTAAGLAAAMTTAGGALIASVAGFFLVKSGATHVLLGMMLISASLALLAALLAAFVDWRASKMGS